MKYSAFLLIIFFCISCSSKKSYKQTILTPNNLPVQLFEIDPAIENTIRTKKGATVRFPANAFKLNGAGKVKVEIKEAYSMKDILLAGLVTETNGKPLSSGGMIYINAQQNNKDIELQKTANVATPTPYVNPDMQLYKGEYNADSTINWVEPKPLDTIPSSMIELGKQLFNTNCASCHNLENPTTGQALRGMLQRAPSKAWLNKFIRNWEDAFRHTDSIGFNYTAYTCCVVQYNPTQNMNKFPALSDADLDALYAFTNSDDYEPNDCTPCLQAKFVTDSFIKTEGYYAPYEWDTTIVNNNTTQFYIPQNITPRDPAELEKTYRQGGFTDMPETANYNFTIATLGWYNIDADYAGLPGTAYCTLSAEITNEADKEELTVYMVMPSKKNLSVSNGTKDDTYIFDKVSGKIPMHLDEQAYVIAFGERNGKVVYGVKPFITKKENNLQLSVSEITEEAFVEHIRKLGLDGLSFSINKKDNNPTSTQSDGAEKATEQPVNTVPENNPQQPRPAAVPGYIADTAKYYQFIDAQGRPCPCYAR